MRAIVPKVTFDLPAELAAKVRRYASASLADYTRSAWRRKYLVVAGVVLGLVAGMLLLPRILPSNAKYLASVQMDVRPVNLSDASERQGDDWGARPVGLTVLQPLPQRRGHLDQRGVQVPASHELVGQARVMAAWRGDHIPAAAAPVHMLQPGGVGVAEAGGGQVVVPAAPAGAHQRPRTLQAMLGRERPDGLHAF